MESGLKSSSSKVKDLSIRFRGEQKMEIQMSSITTLELTCEYAVNPLGVDVPKPRFSWVLESDQRGQMQSAYQILVASSEEKLNADTGDKWESGKVTSDQSVNVAYEGSSLTSGERCCWKVRCWDKDDNAGAYSAPAVFEMGLLEESDWEGEWIGTDASISAPLLRKEFEIDKEVKSARVHISGLGWYELYINGQRVSDNVLDPATTDYAKRILYVTHDVTDLLSSGVNVIGVMLGNGWYSEPGWRNPYGDSPRLLMQMNVELADGSAMSVNTDRSWKASEGPVTRNDLYGGETYNAMLEKPGWTSADYDAFGWGPAVTKGNPGGALRSQLMPPIKVNETIEPIKLTNPKPGVYVYDMGQLFGGWAKLRMKGPAGTKVTIRYSDRLSEETGLIDQRHWQGGYSYPETDFYILKGDGEEVYEPRFTYHPVSHVQIEGYPGEPTIKDLEGKVVYSAVDMSGDFQCSHSRTNAIHRNTVWTVKNGLFGIPLDCLHREHWAWTDPATVAGSLYPRNYMPAFWMKWLDDIKDGQRDDGAIPDITPTYPGNRCDPAWGGNYPILIWYLHQYYDDNRILGEHYDSMKRWMDYLASIADGHIVTEGHYGDHMLPGDSPGMEEFISKETPPPLVWTGYYYIDSLIVSKIAGMLGKTDDAKRYARLAEDIKDAFNSEWLNEDTNQYADGAQTANLLALVSGMVPEASKDGVIENIIKSIKEEYKGHHHTGNTGTTCLLDALTKYGYGDVLYEAVTSPTYPSWGYMVEQGATTIWEAWGLGSRAGGSESMIMWATVDEFFYNDLAGIQGPDYHGPDYMTPGFREICIKPYVPEELEYANASIRTVRGRISAGWKKADNSIALEVTIPVNSKAKVSVPKIGLKNVTVQESGKVIWKDGSYVSGVAGITGGSESADYVSFDVGSGSYSIKLVGTL